LKVNEHLTFCLISDKQNIIVDNFKYYFVHNYVVDNQLCSFQWFHHSVWPKN